MPAVSPQRQHFPEDTRVNNTLDRDILQYTLDWVSAHDVSVTGTEVITGLLPITRRYVDPAERHEALLDAARQIEIARLEAAAAL